ncbi:hypothetical protein D3C73_20470 [compost metagenome]
MNPDQQPVSPAEPQAPVHQPIGAAQSPRRNTRKITAIWLLVGPTALIVFSIAAYAVANLIFNSGVNMQNNNAELFGQQPVAVTIINIILFITGLLGVIAWLPGIIIGIVLLATKR